MGLLNFINPFCRSLDQNERNPGDNRDFFKSSNKTEMERYQYGWLWTHPDDIARAHQTIGHIERAWIIVHQIGADTNHIAAMIILR